MYELTVLQLVHYHELSFAFNAEPSLCPLVTRHPMPNNS